MRGVSGGERSEQAKYVSSKGKRKQKNGREKEVDVPRGMLLLVRCIIFAKTYSGVVVFAVL